MRSRIEMPAVRSAAGELDGETVEDMEISIYDRTSPTLYQRKCQCQRSASRFILAFRSELPRYLRKLNVAKQIRGGPVSATSQETRLTLRISVLLKETRPPPYASVPS